MMINMLSYEKASNGRVITYGINNQADVMAKDIVVKRIN